jgi:hypothetical protein
MAGDITAYVIAGGSALCAVALMIWVILRVRRTGLSKRGAGSFIIASSLILSFGRMFDGAPEQIQTVGDPGRQKRPEGAAPHS